MMNVVGTLDQFEPLFPDDFLHDIIGRVFVAWARIPKPITQTLETRITKLLRHEYAYDPVIRQLPMQVRRELPIDDPATGKELGRIDLCLLHGNDEDVYFAFECKRLNVTFPSGEFKSLASDYVGPDGIGCFVEQKYSVGQNTGGMIGYVFDANIQSACSKIGDQLTAKAKDLALISNGLQDSSILPELTALYETEHQLTDTAFVIYHVFLTIS